VPVLLDQKEVLTDSFDIAIYADKNRANLDNKSLFIDIEKAKEWNTLSEQALSIGRYHCVENQLANKEAQKEILPPFIPDTVKPYFTWLAKDGLNYHLKKYKVEESDYTIYRNILLKLREALKDSDYVLDEFSYCDIAMALALQYLKPIDHRYSVPGPAAAECWTNSELVQEFPDLIQWRDELYRKHR
jgi:glutathione S-transferase